MKSTEYAYEATIIRTDDSNKVMEVLYTSPGRQDILCGVRLPESEDDIGQTIHDAVPFGVWQEAERSFYVPKVGYMVKGIVRPGAPPAVAAPESPAIPFYSPAEQGVSLQAEGQSQEEPTGFPTRYAPDVAPVTPTEPEVTL